MIFIIRRRFNVWSYRSTFYGALPQTAKKGGRMGMVLSEGILNTSNLQKIREYFEGKAN